VAVSTTGAERGLAVITGAAGVLGGRIAERLAGEGHDLLLVDLDPAVTETAQRLAAGAGRGALACVTDLTSAQGADAVVRAAREGGGEVSVLVNNAGITRDRRIGDLEEADFAAVVEVNLTAAIRLTLALETLMAEGSAVINMSSRASLGNFGQANYVASKSGLVGLTRALALRWAPRVRVNALAPSLIDTPMAHSVPERVLEKIVAAIPAGRIGLPDDVASIVAFLASPQASYITGQAIVACGGRSIAP
jgi:NAD(P)-dependent dehydrogenase (short-subunit alcohol dehydrogenase family)